MTLYHKNFINGIIVAITSLLLFAGSFFKLWEIFKMKRTVLLEILVPGIIASFFLVSGCKEKTPTEDNDTPKGEFVQKWVFVKKGSDLSTFQPICVGDLYNNSGTYRLYNVKALANSGSFPHMSKDESWVAYISIMNGLFLRRVNVDGTNDRAIPISPSNTLVQQVKISQDGTHLLLTTGLVGGGSIGLLPVFGGLVKEVFNETRHSYTPEWSADSKRIIFSWIDWKNRFGHAVPPLARAYLATINTDGTDLRFLSDTTSNYSDDNQPSLSPDGKTIAYVSLGMHPGDIFPELFTMDANGGNVKRLTQAAISEKHGNHYDYYVTDNGPHWLKDNEHIIFERISQKYDHTTNDYMITSDLFIINKSGTDLQNLTSDGKSGQ